MSEDEKALLRAICEQPDCDVARLVYADWLEERDTSSDRQYARFVRAQLRGELFSISLIASLRFESLFGSQPHTWRKNATKDGCEANGPNLTGVFRRGCLDEIRCTLAEFMGGKCERCVQRRVDEGYGRFSYRTWLDCPACHGSGNVFGLARTLFEVHPITKVHIYDFNPSCWAIGPEELGGKEWVWERSMTDQPNPDQFTYLGEGPFSRGEAGTSIVPPEIFDAIEGESAGFLFVIGKHNAKRYPTRESALSALSTVCINYARSLHGLTPLTKEQVAA